LTSVATRTGTLTPQATVTVTRTPTATPTPMPDGSGPADLTIAMSVIAFLVLAFGGYLIITNFRNKLFMELLGIFLLSFSGFAVLVPLFTRWGWMQKIIDILRGW
jgi:hypothetical protein